MSDASSFNMWGTLIDAVGKFGSANASYAYGDAAEQAGKFNADQLRTRAGNVMAAATRNEYDADLQAQFIASRAIALAAASGGGASDPTVVSLMAQNAGVAAYKKSQAIWEGVDQARQLTGQAAVAEYEGGVKKASAYAKGNAEMIRGGTSILQGNAKDSSLFQRFGGGGPAQDTSYAYTYGQE